MLHFTVLAKDTIFNNSSLYTFQTFNKDNLVNSRYTSGPDESMRCIIQKRKKKYDSRLVRVTRDFFMKEATEEFIPGSG